MKIKWTLKRVGHRLGLSGLFFASKSFLQFKLKKPHESEFKLFARLVDPLLFVDIGANAGQSVLSFMMFSPKSEVISFEPNPEHRKDLQRLKHLFSSRFRYESLGFGDEIATKKLFIPVVDGIPMTQEATFNLQILKKDPVTLDRIFCATGHKNFEVSETQVNITRFDELNLKPQIVKLDCQGYEIEVLKGMSKTLKASSPLLMIENSELFTPMKDFLNDFNYRAYVFDEARGHLIECLDHPSSLNVFFAPAATPSHLSTLFS